MRKLKFYLLTVVIGIVSQLNLFAQFTPEEGEVYYLIQKETGFALAETAADSQSVITAISSNNPAQRMTFVESSVAGEYFIMTQDQRYWCSRNNNWSMGFASNTTDEITRFRFRMPESDSIGYYFLNCVWKGDLIVATDGTEDGAYTYCDKTFSKVLDKGNWQILKSSELGFGDVTLASLKLSIGDLSPEFNSEITDYEVVVPYGTESLKIEAKANGKGASVAIFDGFGDEITNGIVAFDKDGMDVEIIVAAADKVTQLSYYLAIFVDEGLSDANLKTIETSAGAVDPIFNPDVTDYSLVVPSGSSTVDINGIVNYPGATITGNGTITLSEGKGSTTLKVTSKDGATTKTFTVNVEEADGNDYAISLPGGDGNSSNIDLSGLALNTLPYSVEMWFKAEGEQYTNTGLFFGRNGSTFNSGLQYSSGWQTAGRLRFMTNIFVPETDYGILTDVVSSDVWHHVAIVLTATTRTIYLDDQVYTEAKANIEAYDYSDGKLYLGWDSGDRSRAFKGMMDEVRVWNDSISFETFEAGKYTVLSGDEEKLAAYYNFDLMNSSQIVDATSNKHHGIITGATYAPSFPKSNLELDTLYIADYDIKPGFSAKENQYYLILPTGVTSINIIAEAADPANTVTGAGQVSLEGDKGNIVVAVTSADGKYSNSYTISYFFRIDVPLTLEHSYTFADGTAQDMEGDADGIVVGGSIENGTYTSATLGDFIDLPAADIAINTYPSITVEAYIQAGNGVNTANTMLNYFGNTTGSYGTDYFYTTAANGGKSRAAISVGNPSSPWSQETGVDGLLVEDGFSHHLVSTLTYDTITWYIDGALVGKASLTGTNLIPSLSNTFAYLCKGGYTGDATWLGSIYEFNIYSGVMDEQTIALHSIDFPIEDETTNATLSLLTVDGDTITGFSPYTLSYSVVMPEGSTVPTVGATPKNAAATAVVTATTDIPGTTTVLVTAADGTTKNTYTVNFKFEASTVATLADLAIDGTTVNGFDPAILIYEVTLPANTTVVPTVTATTSDAGATTSITNATSLPGTTTVTVTAEDGTSKITYTINFVKATDVKNAGESLVKVFPTLFTNNFTVQTTGGSSVISMYDLTGKLINKISSNSAQISMSAPRPGMFILVVENKNTVKTFKVIKQNN